MATARAGLDADPPVPPPRGLLPLLHFKRLPDRALAAARKVVDEDEAFRLRVRDATSEESLGRASWLFLDRPSDWRLELARLSAAAEDAVGVVEETKAEAKLRRRVVVLEARLDRGAEERERLEAELAVAKEQLVDERRGRRLAESDAGRRRQEADTLASDVADLRRRHAVLQDVLEGLTRRPPASEEPPAERPAPPAPEVDHAALAGLVADGARAAALLSEALAEAGRLLAPALVQPPSPAAPSPRPEGARRPTGEQRRRPTPLPPGTFEDSVEAAGHLVRVAGVRLLVDGYNVTKSTRPDLALFEQRRWLGDAAVELAARTGARVELVFDGAEDRASAPADLGRRHGVQMRFSAEGTEADDVLLELVEQIPLDVAVVVASDDRRVRDGARQRGANVMTTAQLLAVLGRPPP